MSSTVKAINFQHPSSTAVNMTLASDGTVSGGIPSPNRNILYNGAMQVAQRGTSTASITTAGYYTADRWQTLLSLGTWTQSVENDGPAGTGITKSLKMLCTTANASPAAGDDVLVQQQLEGQDLQRIAKGTSSAQQLTLSFWVKSNVIGTYIASLFDLDTASFRQVSASYTISASATWEKKTINFPADTTGALDNDNAASLRLVFGLGAGSSYTSGTLQTTWAAYNAANRFVGQTNLAAATNNYWQVTGVQLEVGPVASAFEFKPFGQELRECQRYYVRWNATVGTGTVYAGVGVAAQTSEADFYIPMPVPLRANATAIETSGLSVYDYNSSTNRTGGTFTNTYAVNPLTTQVRYSQASVFSLADVVMLSISGSSGYLGISAEL